MTIGAKGVAAGASAVGVVTLLSGLAIHFRPQSDDPGAILQASGVGGAIPGRVVQVPAKDYIDTFKLGTPQLGDCAYKMIDNKIQSCSDKFSGQEIYIPRASTAVDVSKVETVEDIITHGMGGVGVSVGVLGLVSVGVKVNVAVTTKTSKRNINLMSSYEVQRGMMTLQHPEPTTEIGVHGALYLSEIELGANEMIMLTMEFKSESKKVEVTITIKFKILFWTITAKMKFVTESFSSSFSSTVQFQSSFRDPIKETFGSDEKQKAVKRVEEIETMYVQGPSKVRDLDVKETKLHYTYYFAAWKKSPFVAGLNSAVANVDVSSLTEQNAEAKSVIDRIENLQKESWSTGVTNRMNVLKQEMETMSKKLEEGLKKYYTVSLEERDKLRRIYGENKAPNYYQRQLQSIVGF